MRVGLFMQPVHHPSENPTLALERDLQLIEHLDALDYDEAWIGEHHSTGWETVAAPEIFIMAAAARTRHIKLGSGVRTAFASSSSARGGQLCAFRSSDKRSGDVGYGSWRRLAE